MLLSLGLTILRADFDALVRTRRKQRRFPQNFNSPHGSIEDMSSVLLRDQHRQTCEYQGSNPYPQSRPTNLGAREGEMATRSRGVKEVILRPLKERAEAMGNTDDNGRGSVKANEPPDDTHPMQRETPRTSMLT